MYMERNKFNLRLKLKQLNIKMKFILKYYMLLKYRTYPSGQFSKKI